MENKINIAELLKDCPSGMELDCTMYENVYFDKIYDKDCLYQIGCYTINDGVRNSINFTKYGKVNTTRIAKCVIFPKGKTTWEGFQRPFKDGDVLVHTQNDRFIMSIYKSNKNEQLINTYAIFWDREEGLSVGMQLRCYTDNVRLATKEEKEKLFDAIKANGYKWNPETKTLEKVLNKFDITILIPFESKVLVRDCDYVMWKPTFWGKYLEHSIYSYLTSNGRYKQCIPYEGNEHLLGTTNDCDEYYKIWEN